MVIVVKESSHSEGDMSLILGSWRFSGINLGFPGSTSSKESACQCRRHERCGVYSCIGKIPWSMKWQPTPVFLPGKFHWQRSLVGYSPQVHKESDMTERVHICTHTCTHGDKVAQAIQALNLLLRKCSKPKAHSQAANWSRKTACTRLPFPVIIIRFIVSLCVC